jgi:hypothetical protein
MWLFLKLFIWYLHIYSIRTITCAHYSKWGKKFSIWTNRNFTKLFTMWMTYTAMVLYLNAVIRLESKERQNTSVKTEDMALKNHITYTRILKNPKIVPIKWNDLCCLEGGSPVLYKKFIPLATNHYNTLKTIPF